MRKDEVRLTIARVIGNVATAVTIDARRIRPRVARPLRKLNRIEHNIDARIIPPTINLELNLASISRVKRNFKARGTKGGQVRRPNRIRVPIPLAHLARVNGKLLWGNARLNKSIRIGEGSALERPRGLARRHGHWSARTPKRRVGGSRPVHIITAHCRGRFPIRHLRKFGIAVGGKDTIFTTSQAAGVLILINKAIPIASIRDKSTYALSVPHSILPRGNMEPCRVLIGPHRDEERLASVCRSPFRRIRPRLQERRLRLPYAIFLPAIEGERPSLFANLLPAHFIGTHILLVVGNRRKGRIAAMRRAFP